MPVFLLVVFILVVPSTGSFFSRVNEIFERIQNTMSIVMKGVDQIVSIKLQDPFKSEKPCGKIEAVIAIKGFNYEKVSFLIIAASI